MIVIPCFLVAFSTSFCYRCISTGDSQRYRVGTHLCCPPPFSCLHVMVHPYCVVCISIVMLQLKCEIHRKFRIAPQGLQTLYNVPCIQLEGFSSNDDFMPLEARTAWELIVNYHIELIRVLVRQGKCFMNLVYQDLSTCQQALESNKKAYPLNSKKVREGSGAGTSKFCPLGNLPVNLGCEWHPDICVVCS